MSEITKDHELGKRKSKGIYSNYLQSLKLVISQKESKVCWNFSSKKSFCRSFLGKLNSFE